ncbi:hypothetical protein CQK57_21485 [Salmonella enterica]|uniref:Big-1 domain-containing protein n=2 Tax=Salmonella enterica I TaxID=59201 RepID=A0A5X7K6E5_SALET|nr:hypothetical protein [Salmonella enterica]EBG8070690.1 hypothetical protein [Salmonella enterica subsp. enterica serovar Elisabethville]EBU7169595.1 hypothetical protein [Salmonella enterica subsp. enterica serovar Stockholm]ECA1252832.1 hypothetical protein [Salmonella enterica subsp. enterica serovar Chailey]ECA7542798.1 hypothetical protein [Salmonella enterica subsp. enterica serovar Strasbourg]ECB0591264.1 hypothetical protein [Salmonella enterica subsp. enterica serovar Bareilly]ECB0
MADASTAHLDKLTASTQSILADGTSAITLTASVIDQTGHPVKNEQINWNADNDKARLSDKQTMTDESGQAQIQVTSTDVITTVITAQHNQAEALHSEPLNLTADLASTKVTVIDSEKQQVMANNTDTETITVQVRDDYNHPLRSILRGKRTSGRKSTV